MSPELRGLLAELYTPAEAAVWMRSRQPLFNDRVPEQMIIDGDEALLVSALHAIIAGVHT